MKNQNQTTPFAKANTSTPMEQFYHKTTPTFAKANDGVVSKNFSCGGVLAIASGVVISKLFPSGGGVANP
jgi:hypothetical protein